MGKSTFFVLTARYEFVMEAIARKGICVVERWERRTRLGSLTSAPWRQEWPSMKKKLNKTESADVKHLAAVETVLFRDLMSLVEHCSIRKYDDGDARDPGWITIKTTGAAGVV